MSIQSPETCRMPVKPADSKDFYSKAMKDTSFIKNLKQRLEELNLFQKELFPKLFTSARTERKLSN